MKLFLFLLIPCLCSCSSIHNPDYSGNSRRVDTSASFIMAGDVQLRGIPEIILNRENNRAAVEKLFKKIADESPSFIVLLGDLTYCGGVHSLWDEFDELAEPIRKTGIPVFPLPGNHEYLGEAPFSVAEGIETTGYTKDRYWAEEYFSRFPLIQQKLWYSKRWKDVGIIMLNSNFLHLEISELRDEMDWYKEQLQVMQHDSSLSIIIVACHHAPFTNGIGKNFPDGEDSAAREYFAPPYLLTPKAKLFIAGHCHSYEHFKIDNKDFIVSGGGGPVREVNIANPEWSDLYKGPANHPSKRNHHFCSITRTQNGLQFRMIRLDDNLKDWVEGDSFDILTK